MQMNLPGSAMGACRRTEASGLVTGSNLPDLVASTIAPSMSWVTTPPSRKPRVLLCGKSAAAIAWARTTPLPCRYAAQLASRSTTRSAPRKHPSCGAWPFWENRTIFMGRTSLADVTVRSRGTPNSARRMIAPATDAGRNFTRARWNDRAWAATSPAEGTGAFSATRYPADVALWTRHWLCYSDEGLLRQRLLLAVIFCSSRRDVEARGGGDAGEEAPSFTSHDRQEAPNGDAEVAVRI